MAEIHELPIRRDVPDCIEELMDVLMRHQGSISNEDACINILGNIAMVFGGQDAARAAELLHETFLSLTAFYDVPVVIERDRDGKGTMRVSASSQRKPE